MDENQLIMTMFKSIGTNNANYLKLIIDIWDLLEEEKPHKEIIEFIEERGKEIFPHRKYK